jgi:hypothetical protein
MAGSPSNSYREFKARLSLCTMRIVVAAKRSISDKDFNPASSRDKGRRSKPRDPKVPRKRF